MPHPLHMSGSNIRCTTRAARSGRAMPLVEHVTLQLAQRLRLLDLTAVGIHHRVARVFPTHVFVAKRRAGLVFLEAVAVEIAVAIDPLEAALGHVAVLAEEPIISEPS